MKVLVAYASKTGFTKGIAEFVGEKLRRQGLQVDIMDVRGVKETAAYDAFVVGSAVYMYHWLKEAKEFIEKNEGPLSARPTWLFSSGPIGTKTTDSEGRNLLETSVPKEFEELKSSVNFRGHRVFYGGLDGSKLTGFMSLGYKMAMHSKAARESMQEGDFRDWNAIEAWTNEIARALVRPTIVAPQA